MKYAFLKKYLVLLCLVFVTAVTFLAFSQSKYNIVGKWSILNQDGTPSKEYIDFFKDSTYAVALPNGQIGERGFYLLKDSTFSIKNVKNVCGKDYWGTYRLNFYGEDSIHFAVISDTCSPRRTDIVGYNPGLKRIVAKVH